MNRARPHRRSVDAHATPPEAPCMCCGCTTEKPCRRPDGKPCHVVLMMPTEQILLCSACWNSDGRRRVHEFLADIKSQHAPRPKEPTHVG